jgi:hypothetical protein
MTNIDPVFFGQALVDKPGALLTIDHMVVHRPFWILWRTG